MYKQPLIFFRTLIVLVSIVCSACSRNDQSLDDLYDAVLNDNLSQAQTLISNGSDINQRNLLGETPLHLACKLGLVDMSKLLIQNGSDVNAVTKAGNTPLHEVACGDYIPVKNQSEHAEVAELLLKNGARYAITNDAGLTATDLAMQYHHEDVVSVINDWVNNANN